MNIRSEDGFVSRIIATIMTMIVVGLVLALGGVLTWLTVSHDAYETIADHIALQLAASGQPNPILLGARLVGSQTQLAQCTSKCYYVIQYGNSNNPVWKVAVNNPLMIDGHPIASYAVGVAPWQPS